MPAFSPAVIGGLVEAITGGSGNSTTPPPIGIYRRGFELEKLFADVGLDLRIGQSSRVPAVRDLLRSVNDGDEGFAQMQAILERTVDLADYRDAAPRHAVVTFLNERLRGDGFELQSLNGRYRLYPLGAHAPVVAAITESARLLDLESVRLDFERALQEADSDPEDAITSACSAVESVCKCLLDHMGKDYPSKLDISHLVQEVQKHLDLSPAQPDLGPDVKQILTGLISIAGGVGALRTHAGDAHGRGLAFVRSESVLARLAIHAGSTISLFFLEIWQRQHQ
jgi:HEPN domain-containing protein